MNRATAAIIAGLLASSANAQFTIETVAENLELPWSLAFLPDGTLLMPTGDGFAYREEAQKLDTLLGKIVRIYRDGSIPDDNPFVGREDARPEIWSYGHRNPQAILVDPVSGNVYEHEHGPRGGDELNQIEPGKNYGWTAITYGRDYNFASITPCTEYPGME